MSLFGNSRGIALRKQARQPRVHGRRRGKVALGIQRKQGRPTSSSEEDDVVERPGGALESLKGRGPTTASLATVSWQPGTPSGLWLPGVRAVWLAPAGMACHRGHWAAESRVRGAGLDPLSLGPGGGARLGRAEWAVSHGCSQPGIRGQ